MSKKYIKSNATFIAEFTYFFIFFFFLFVLSLFSVCRYVGVVEQDGVHANVARVNVAKSGGKSSGAS